MQSFSRSLMRSYPHWKHQLPPSNQLSLFSRSCAVQLRVGPRCVEQTTGFHSECILHNSITAAIPPHANPNLIHLYTRPLLVENIPGLVPYRLAWQWQKAIVRSKIDFERNINKEIEAAQEYANQTTPTDSTTIPPYLAPLIRGDLASMDRLLILEHEPIYTLGRNSTLDHLHFPPHIKVNVVERGELTAPISTTSSSSAPSSPLSTAATSSPSTSMSSSTSPTEYDLVRVERGGEVTYHGPGQIVMYSLLALNPTPIPVDRDATLPFPLTSTHRPYRPDLHWFLRSLESVIIRFLQLYQIQGERIPGASGVWVNMSQHPAPISATSSDSSAPTAASPVTLSRMKKIAAMGLSCSSWISMHGCAINIDPSFEPYDWIVPCGLSDSTKYGGVTSLKQILIERNQTSHLPLDHDRIRRQLIQCFLDEFGIELHSNGGHIQQSQAIRTERDRN